jgi:AcrR family transcriptional regulator
MGRENRRDQLLDAARAVILGEGPLALTLDAVGARAQVSKGGVLYHFPSKAALVVALVQRQIERFEVDLEQALVTEAPGRGRFLRAYLTASLAEAEREGALTGLLAALVHEPGLLELWREKAAQWGALACQDGLEPVQAACVLSAIDGLWLSMLAGLPRHVPLESLAAWLREWTR